MHKLTTRVKAVLHYLNFESSIRRVAKIYGVRKSSVARWIKWDTEDLLRRRETPRARTRWVRDKVIGHIDRALQTDHFQSAGDLQSMLKDKCSMSVSLSTIARCRQESGYRYKVATRSQQHQRADRNHPLFSDPTIFDDCIAVDESSRHSSSWMGEVSRVGAQATSRLQETQKFVARVEPGRYRRIRNPRRVIQRHFVLGVFA